MGLKERFQRKITLSVLERQCIIIITLLATLLLVTNWPRFLNDAMSLDWYWYVVLILLATVPILRRLL